MIYEKKKLSQYFTPVWAAEILYDIHFSHLKPTDLLWEPTCGNGNMLAAIPSNIPCVGTELDPKLVAQARRIGRPVIEGNCLTADLSAHGKVTAVFGNPPFVLDLFERLLERCSTMLGLGHKAGFIIPAYFLQTSRTVMRFSKKWSIDQEMLPRDIFPNLIKPLAFGTFIRDNSPRLVGFRLYAETAAMKEFSEEMRETLSHQVTETRGVWKNAIMKALSRLGGKASLNDIYASMRDNRPTKNSFWKEQIRKVLRESFVKIDTGMYALSAN